MQSTPNTAPTAARRAATLAAALASGALLATGAAPAGADSGAATASADRAPANVFARVRVTAREGDVLLRVRGGLALPGAAYGPRNCFGTVRVAVRQSGFRLGARRARVDRRCNFRRTVRLTDESHPECGRKVRVKVRFLGNERVAPDSTSRLVRVC